MTLKPDLADFNVILRQSYTKSYAFFAHQGAAQIS